MLDKAIIIQSKTTEIIQIDMDWNDRIIVSPKCMGHTSVTLTDYGKSSVIEGKTEFVLFNMSDNSVSIDRLFFSYIK